MTEQTTNESAPQMISGFKGKYRFLSNFFIEPDGTYVEIEYQRLKCADPAEECRFERTMSPSQAKRMGAKVKLRPDWEEIKIDIMYDLVRQKFVDHVDLQYRLKDTGQNELVEANYWGDVFWGVDERTGAGRNELGKILMRIRTELDA